MYDEKLAQRIRDALCETTDVTEKRMFGGVGFMLRGNMVCGVIRDQLIVRVGPDSYEQALAEPHTRPLDMTGRPMRGWVTVGPAGYESEDALKAWVQRGVGFSLTLAPK